MENPILKAKTDLMKWISDLDDLEILSALMQIKENSQLSMVAESQAEYEVADDFEERFAKGLTSEEARKRKKTFIRSLPWKK